MFSRVRFQGIEFDYSPCLHISTFRVAEAYGRPVETFKRELQRYFDNALTQAASRLRHSPRDLIGIEHSI